jgi:hypothetical protein
MRGPEHAGAVRDAEAAREERLQNSASHAAVHRPEQLPDELDVDLRLRRGDRLTRPAVGAGLRVRLEDVRHEHLADGALQAVDLDRAEFELPGGSSAFMLSTEFAMMIFRGPTFTVRGLSTPSSSAIHMPASARSMLPKDISIALFRLLMSGSASKTGPTG